MKLNDLLAVSREVKGWTLRRLEKETGLSSGYLSQVETGHIAEPSFRSVVKIAKALGVSLKRVAEAE